MGVGFWLRLGVRGLGHPRTFNGSPGHLYEHDQLTETKYTVVIRQFLVEKRQEASPGSEIKTVLYEYVSGRGNPNPFK